VANKTINQLPNAAVVATDEYEKQVTGGGASQKNTAAQLLTFIQNNATAFAQTINMSGNLNFGAHANILGTDGSANFANNNAGFDAAGNAVAVSFIVGVGIIELFADGHAVFANGVIIMAGTGDIEITDTTKGLILKSANGTRYRLKVDNAGNLGTVAA